MERTDIQIAAEEADREKAENWYNRDSKPAKDGRKGHNEKEERGKEQDRLTFSQKKKSDAQAAFKEFTALNAPRSKFFLVAKEKNLLERIRRMHAMDSRRDQSKFYAHHNTHGHLREDCFDLKQQIEKAVKKGELKEFPADKGKIQEQTDSRARNFKLLNIRKDPEGSPGAPQRCREEPSLELDGMKEEVYTISGGPTARYSNAQRKKRARSKESYHITS